MTAALAAPLSTATAIPSAANPAAADLSGVSEWVVGVMESVGAPGAGLVVALDNLFPPIPSGVVLPLAGFTGSRGAFSLLDAILWTTAGSLLGAYVLYLLGGWLGLDRTRAPDRPDPFGGRRRRRPGGSVVRPPRQQGGLPGPSGAAFPEPRLHPRRDRPHAVSWD